MASFDDMLKKFMKESNRKKRDINNRNREKLEGVIKGGKVKQSKETDTEE